VYAILDRKLQPSPASAATDPEEEATAELKPFDLKLAL
jgi:hypothetical protein